MSPVCFRAVFDEKYGLWLTGPQASIPSDAKLAPSDGSSWSVEALVPVAHQRLSLASRLVIQDFHQSNGC